ncbi:hypothetical protein TI03_07185, partial [Achromatium sp. WMS1]
MGKIKKGDKKMNLSKTEYNKATFFYEEIMNAFKMDFSLYADLVDILEPKSVLEFGCGMGRLFSIFAKTANFITGVDLSDEMLATGRKDFAKYGFKNTVAEFCKADMRSFKGSRKYDLVVMALSVLKHLPTDEDRFEALKNRSYKTNLLSLRFVTTTINCILTIQLKSPIFIAIRKM